MEKQVFPEIKIVDIKALKERAGAFLSNIWNMGHVTELCLSEHRRGASVMLDEALEPQLFSYDDMGNYTSNVDGN